MSGHYKKMYGLPCHHDICKYELLNTGLSLELVQQQWILRLLEYMFIYLIIAPCRCRGLGVRFPSTIICHGFPTWYRLVVRIDTLTLRGQGSNPPVCN
jgi:hypothetical protein